MNVVTGLPLKYSEINALGYQNEQDIPLFNYKYLQDCFPYLLASSRNPLEFHLTGLNTQCQPTIIKVIVFFSTGPLLH